MYIRPENEPRLDSRLERIVNALLQHGSSLSDIGLLHGKMGVALFFFLLSRRKEYSIYQDYAFDLLNDVNEGIYAGMDLNFTSGLTGIGWAVEYLTHNAYIADESHDFLDELDVYFSENSISPKGLDLGIPLYFLQRIKNSNDPSKTKSLILPLQKSMEMAAARVEENLPALALDLIYPHFSATLLWYVWMYESCRSRGIRFPFDCPENYWKQKLAEYAIHPANKYMLQRMNPGLYQEDCLLDLGFTDEMKSPLVQDGIAGFILMLSQFSPTPPLSLIRTFQQRLAECPDIPSKYAGYDLCGRPEADNWGILSGLTGVGLALLVNSRE